MPNQDQLRKEIRQTARKIQQLTEQEKYRTIDVDILLEQLRDVYDHLLAMKNGQHEHTPSSPPSEQIAAAETEKTATPSQETPPEPPPEESATDSDESDTPEDDPSVRAKKEIKDEYRKRKKIEADLNQMFSEHKTELVDKLQDEPLHDMKSAIGVNQRYAFLHVLFGGNKSAYNAALKYLDRCRKKKDAFHFVDELAETYEWDEDEEQQQVVQQLRQLVDRKFNS